MKQFVSLNFMLDQARHKLYLAQAREMTQTTISLICESPSLLEESNPNL